MEFIYKIYTKFPISVKVSGRPRIALKKGKKGSRASKINRPGTSVQLMDKTDIILADSEGFQQASGNRLSGKGLTFRPSRSMMFPLRESFPGSRAG